MISPILPVSDWDTERSTWAQKNAALVPCLEVRLIQSRNKPQVLTARRMALLAFSLFCFSIFFITRLDNSLAQPKLQFKCLGVRQAEAMTCDKEKVGLDRFLFCLCQFAQGHSGVLWESQEVNQNFLFVLVLFCLHYCCWWWFVCFFCPGL